MAPAWRKAFRWPWSLDSVWLLMVPGIVTLIIAVKPIPPHDYWLHIVLGREIAATGSIPRTSSFLYTLAADAPFHDLPWLGQWLMFRLYDSFGHLGNAVALSVCALGAWLIVLDAALRRSERVRIVALVAALSALLGTPMLVARTQMFAFPLYAALLAVLFGVADERLSRRWLLALAPVSALWANLHGSFVLCPVLVGAVGCAHLFERRPGRTALASWAGASALAAAGGLISPLGIGNYEYVLTLSTVKNVTEWQPPSVLKAEGAITWIAIAAACLLVVASLRRARLHEIALLALVAFLAGSATRHVFWFAASLPLVLPRLIAERLRPRSDACGVPALNATFVGVLAMLIVTLQPGILLERMRIRLVPIARSVEPGAGLLSKDHPLRLAQRLARDPPVGKLFHEQRVGGLIELALCAPGRPAQVAFVDQRMDLVPERVWQDYFAISAAEDWQRRLAQFRVTALLLHETAQRKLLDAAEASSEWREVDREGPYRLLMRDPVATR